MKRNLVPVQALVRELVPVVGSFAPVAVGGVLAFDAGTGEFTVDEVVTGGTSAAVGTIAAITPATSKLDFDAGTGRFTVGQVVTGGTSDAVGTISAITPVTQKLAYDGQSGNFTVGQIVTGTTSGAVGTIDSDTDAGATGTLVLSSVVGVFEDNEALTDPITGAAVANGILLPFTGSLTLTGVVGTVENNEALTDPLTGAAVEDGVLLTVTGTLTLTGVVGVFVNNEALTDPVTGAATEDGAITYSANAPTDLKGLGFTVAYVSSGLFKVTFSDGFNSLVSAKACLQLNTAADKLCQIGVVDLTAKTMEIRLWDKSAAAVLDLAAADANNRIHFVAMFRASAVKPEYGP